MACFLTLHSNLLLQYWPLLFITHHEIKAWYLRYLHIKYSKQLAQNSQKKRYVKRYVEFNNYFQGYSNILLILRSCMQNIISAKWHKLMIMCMFIGSPQFIKFLYAVTFGEWRHKDILMFLQRYTCLVHFTHFCSRFIFAVQSSQWKNRTTVMIFSAFLSHFYLTSNFYIIVSFSFLILIRP